MESVGSVRTGGIAPQAEDLAVRTGVMGEAEGAPSIDLTSDHVDRDPSSARRWGPDTAGGRAGETERATSIEPAAFHESVGPAAGAAHALATEGWSGFDRWIDAHPEDTRALISAPRDELAFAMRTALTQEYGGPLGGVRAWFDADQAVGRLDESTVPMVREAVRRDAVAHIDAQLAALEETSPEQLVAHLRGAAAGTPEARLATCLGIFGEADDVANATGHREHAMIALHSLRDAVMSQHWSPDELPGTSRRVATDQGLEGARQGSIAADAFQRDPFEGANVAGHVEMGADAGLAAFEVAELAHAAHAAHAAHVSVGVAVSGTAVTAVAISVGVAVAGIAFGVALHHAIEHNRDDRRELARQFGL